MRVTCQYLILSRYFSPPLYLRGLPLLENQRHISLFPRETERGEPIPSAMPAGRSHIVIFLVPFVFPTVMGKKTGHDHQSTVEKELFVMLGTHD